MKTILICNQKGGVGKSLIADEITYSFERSKIPTAFLDLDQQGGTNHKTNRREDAKVCIIDTPGALQPEMGNWMADADLIVIPTKPTSRDIPPLLRMKSIANSAAIGKPIIYIVNGFNRYTAAADFLDWIKGQTDATILTLPQSERFIQASARGESIVTYIPSSPAAIATLKMTNTIRRAVGFNNEEI